MKLGTACINPLTGEHGFVQRFNNGVPMGVSRNGKQFKAAGAQLNKSRFRVLCEVRVVDHGEVLSQWMPAERLESGDYLLRDDAVWAGAVVKASAVEVKRGG